MKQIIALQEYTDKYISLYEGEIRNIEDGIADKLIEEGIIAEHGDGGNSSSGGFIKVFYKDYSQISKPFPYTIRTNNNPFSFSVESFNFPTEQKFEIDFNKMYFINIQFFSGLINILYIPLSANLSMGGIDTIGSQTIFNSTETNLGISFQLDYDQYQENKNLVIGYKFYTNDSNFSFLENNSQIKSISVYAFS